jgi:hypothetical protein
MGAASLRARVLLRHRWPAAILLGLVAGLGGGGVIGLVTIARDTGSSLDRFLGRLDPPDAFVSICPKGADPAGPSASQCLRHNPVDELAAIRRDPRVREAGRLSPAPVLVHTATGWSPANGWVSYDGVRVFGRPKLVAGRLADPEVADEAMVSESLAAEYGVRPGSRLEVAPLSWQELDGAEFGQPELSSRRLLVTGVLRTPRDLAPVKGGAATDLSGEMIFFGPAWVKATGEGTFARFLTGLGVYVQPGVDASAVVDRAAPDQVHVVETSIDAVDVGDTRETVDYEARAALAAALVLVLALAVFVGQMVARQARRDLLDAPPLRALGMTTRQVVLSAAPRWLVTSGAMLVVATATAALTRSIGPVGVARRAVGRPPASVDPAVLGIGLVLASAFMLSVALLATAVAYRVRPLTSRAARARTMPLSVAPTVGLAMTNRVGHGQRGSRAIAVLASAAAVAAVIAAPTLRTSLHRLSAAPPRYGDVWDAIVSGPTGTESVKVTVSRLEEVDGIEAVAGISGGAGRIGEHQLYVYSFAPVAGLPGGVEPVIARGRPPTAPDEIALGARSLAAAHARLGDTVALSYGGREHRMRVVGEVLVNDGYEPVPGIGALVTPGWLAGVDRALYPSDFAVRFRPDAREHGVAELRTAFGIWTSTDHEPRAVVNLERISDWPLLLAALVAAMAMVGFVHALIVSLREQRRPLAIMKALGASRRQVGAGVLWHASFLALPAILIGVPLGVVLGRAGWGVFARNLGVVSGAVVSPIVLVLVALAALVITNVLAAVPSWRAAHLATAASLRAE